MKIIFLDFDGVLNTYDRGLGRLIQPNPECVTNLNRLTDVTGAVIVVSSSWRQGGESQTRRILLEWGVTGKMLGITPYEHRRHAEGTFLLPRHPVRGAEIEAFLDGLRRGLVESFAILDDSDDMEPYLSRLVQTDYYHGLTKEVAERTIEILLRSI